MTSFHHPNVSSASLRPKAPPIAPRRKKDSEFSRDVIDGLSATPKSIPSKYLYDEAGSNLFRRITRLPEYYPTRAETEILEQHAHEIAELFGPSTLILEPGSGEARKVRILLDHLRTPAGYVPIEISKSSLRVSVGELQAQYPNLRVFPVAGDFESVDPLSAIPSDLSVSKKNMFFPGSTIGNLEPADAKEFLARSARIVGPKGGVLVGVDTKKDSLYFDLAYDDPIGVTADFNLNLLHRANRELGANFVPAQFRHRAHYDPVRGRVEMHLVSDLSQMVTIGSGNFFFERGETIHTENSYKYSPEEFQSLAAGAGLHLRRVWQDCRRFFAVFYFDTVKRIGA